MSGYELILNEMAAMALVNAPRREQRRLAVALDALKIDPFQIGDLQERDAQGRTNEVAVADDWLITYWSDHAAREIRIVNLELVED